MEHKLLNNCVPVDKDTLKYVYENIKECLNKYIISPIGSYCKKKDGELYNDLDIAIQESFDNRDSVISLLRDKFDGYILLGNTNCKLNVFNIGFRISESRFLQVDFMFVDNIEYAKFAYHSPDFSKSESKYKGMYASVLLQSIIRNIPLDREYFEDGTLKEWKYYSLSQKDGLLLKEKTFVSKKGNKVKTSRLIYEKFITNNPNEIINIIFGNKEAFDYIYTFEGLLYYICSNKFNVIFKYSKKEFLERVKNDFLTDWELCLKTSDELKKEFEYLFNEKINSL